MRSNTITMPPLDLRAEVGAVNEDRRSVDLTFASADADVMRLDWVTGRRFYERLSLDKKHVRMQRLQSGTAPLLDSHSGFSLSNVIGVVEGAAIEAKRGTATVRFSKRAEVEPFYQDVRDKIIRNVSVGYRVHRFEELQETRDGLQVRLAVDWEPYEISMVPIGADANARTRGGDGVETNPCELVSNQEQTMEPNQPPAEERSAQQNERERILGIQNACRIGNLEPSVALQLVERGVSLDEARRRILDMLAERSDSIVTNNHVRTGGERRVFDGGLGVDLPAMVEALAARVGGPAPTPLLAERAAEFKHSSVLDMARMVLEARGVSTRSLSPHVIMQRATHTTSDFPELLTGTGARIMRQGYESYQGGVIRVCRKSSARDFRAKSTLQLGEAPELLLVAEGGEFKHGTMAESKQSYSLATYGRIFGITRQALVNDDLDSFGTMAAKLGRAAAEFVAAQLASKLASNPTMVDSVALFHASHGNLGTTGAISITTLTEALKMMRLQKGLDGATVIDVTPKFLIVPAALEVVARQYVAQINATKSSDVNPFAADLEVVVEPRLDAVSATAWYLAADPAMIDGIEYSFLEGTEGPVVESRAGFEVDGVEMKVRLDFGCGVLDHRGLFKNAGA